MCCLKNKFLCVGPEIKYHDFHLGGKFEDKLNLCTTFLYRGSILHTVVLKLLFHTKNCTKGLSNDSFSIYYFELYGLRLKILAWGLFELAKMGHFIL